MSQKRWRDRRAASKRRRLLAGLLVGAALVGLGLFLYVGGEDEDPDGASTEETAEPTATPTDMPTERGQNLASELEGGDPEILVLDNGTLKLYDAASGKAKDLGFLPSFEVQASPYSESVAYVVEESPEGAPSSNLFFFDIAKEKEVRVDEGARPFWRPGRDEVAFLSPAREGTCVKNTCKGKVSVRLAKPGDKDTEELVPAGQWDLVGWAGPDHVLLRDVKKGKPSTIGNVVRFSVEDGTKEKLSDVAATDVFEVSPDGEWLLTTGREGQTPRFIALEGDGQEVEIPTEGTILTGGWAHDSSQVIAQIPDPIEGNKELVRFWPDSPEPKPLPGSDGASGRLSWSPDNDALTYARLNTEDTVLEAVYCELDAVDECEVVFTWQTGLIILRMQ